MLYIVLFGNVFSFTHLNTKMKERKNKRLMSIIDEIVCKSVFYLQFVDFVNTFRAYLFVCVCLEINTRIICLRKSFRNTAEYLHAYFIFISKWVSLCSIFCLFIGYLCFSVQHSTYFKTIKNKNKKKLPNCFSTFALIWPVQSKQST